MAVKPCFVICLMALITNQGLPPYLSCFVKCVGPNVVHFTLFSILTEHSIYTAQNIFLIFDNLLLFYQLQKI
jgi:hypothetical protein